MPIASVNGTELFFEDEGRGTPLVFVPGLGGSHAMFAPQAEAFRGSHRVIRLDLRGNGRSGRLDGPIGTVIDRQCDDLAALFDRLGLDRVVLIGVSYGGAVVLRFARRHPDRLWGLVLVDTFAELRWTRPMEALIRVSSVLMLPGFFLPRPVLRASLRLFYHRWPAAMAAIPDLIDGFRPREAALQSEAMCLVDEAKHAGEIGCPSLGIVGEYSKTAVRLMERATLGIPGARLEVVPDAFDPTNLCQPEAFARRLAEFLSRLGCPGGQKMNDHDH
ncbi:alpha/beta fold hydrolase [Tautonia sociabilis]|nr:alpha/beta hydrolase [Tautonia sociabilis]